MFEDFKDKIRQHNSEQAEPQSFPPEVIAIILAFLFLAKA